MRACIDEYGGLVWSLARRFLADSFDAEDAVQEVFVELWRSAGRYDPAVASEATFVAMIARRRLIDRVRRIGRRPRVSDIDESPPAAPTPPASTDDDACRAAAVLETLPEPQQRSIRLAVVHGLSHQQVAEATGLPLGTVKTHIRRGLCRIREALASEGMGVSA